MPSVSDKQRRFMAAAAHNPKFAKEAGIPQSVAKDFNAADAKKKRPKAKDFFKHKHSQAEMKDD